MRVGSLGFESCFPCSDFVLGFHLMAGLAESLSVGECVWVFSVSESWCHGFDVVGFGGWLDVAVLTPLISCEDLSSDLWWEGLVVGVPGFGHEGAALCWGGAAVVF